VGGDPIDILLLRERCATGRSGVDDPLWRVDLIVMRRGEIVYRFSDSAPASGGTIEPVFWIDDAVGARDVTNDGVPEVLFRSVFMGASDWYAPHHVLRPSAGGIWREEALQPFADSWRTKFAWTNSGQRVVGVAARPHHPEQWDDRTSCHSCPHSYHYDVYEWSDAAKIFVMKYSFPGSREFADDEDPLVADAPRIREGLSAR
jgi:hypothetical protein